MDLCCCGQYTPPASYGSRFEPMLKPDPIVAKSRPFSAQKEEVAASASIITLEWLLTLVDCGTKPTDLLVARLLADIVCFLGW